MDEDSKVKVITDDADYDLSVYFEVKESLAPDGISPRNLTTKAE